LGSLAVAVSGRLAPKRRSLPSTASATLGLPLAASFIATAMVAVWPIITLVSSEPGRV
jgi:hypothetical protein